MMEGVARAISKSRSSLQYYFNSKAEVVNEPAASSRQKLLTEAAQATTEATATDDKRSTFGVTWRPKLRQRASLDALLAREALYHGGRARARAHFSQ